MGHVGRGGGDLEILVAEAVACWENTSGVKVAVMSGGHKPLVGMGAKPKKSLYPTVNFKRLHRPNLAGTV